MSGEVHEPAMVMRFRAHNSGDAKLYVILAADGTPLDAMQDTLHTVPIWVMHLILLPEVHVTPTVYRQMWQDYAALAIRRGTRLARQG